MNTREIEAALASSDPVDRDQLNRLDFGAMEAELLADLDGEQPASPFQDEASRRRRPRHLALTLAGAAIAATAVAIMILSGGTSEHGSRAYGAELVRFAESTPLLLLESPGWRVQNADEERGPEGTYGSMEFVTGKPIPYESIRITSVGLAPHEPSTRTTPERESGMFPPPVRQRRVELFWRHGSLAETVALAHKMLHPHGQRWIELPLLGTTASVDTRAEFFVNQGGPGNRQMTAFWGEDGYVLELKAAVPDLAAFEERLAWLTKVDSETWLDAMPAKVVKAADHGAAVREMLKGIPVPRTFKPSEVPDTGLTTARYQVGAAVTGTVSCLWFRQWGEARRSGDRAAEAKPRRQWPLPGIGRSSIRWPRTVHIPK